MSNLLMHDLQKLQRETRKQSRVNERQKDKGGQKESCIQDKDLQEKTKENKMF